MRTKILFIAVLAMLLASCANPTASAVSPAPVVVQPSVQAVQPTQAPINTPSPAPVPSPTPMPTSYEGYWLKFIHNPVLSRTEFIKLMYEKDGQDTEIAEFCAHSNFILTTKGFYFIVADEPTVYPSAPGYGAQVFPNNFKWLVVSGANKYIHSAPWNNSGPFNCPVNRSHGCVNMRPGDFAILVFGGTYTNPFTGEVSQVDPIKIGTPFVIVPTDNYCTSVANCMQNLHHCPTGRDCFGWYTCASCANSDADSEWATLVSEDPILSVLDK